MRYWAYKIKENDRMLAIEGGFECEADAEEAAEKRKDLYFPDRDGLEIRTFQPPYDPDWEKTEKRLREMIAGLIEETQRLEEKYGEVISFMNTSGIEVGDPQFDALNEIKDGEEDIDLIVAELLLQDNDEDNE